MSVPADRRATRARWLAVLVSLAVIAAVVGALVAIGPPSTQRRLALDNRRAQQLFALANAIDQRFEVDRRLPARLADLDGAGQWLRTTDPETGAAYGYAVTGDRTYRLCAVFATATTAADQGFGRADGAWAHPAGRHCFDRRARTR